MVEEDANTQFLKNTMLLVVIKEGGIRVQVMLEPLLMTDHNFSISDVSSFQQNQNTLSNLYTCTFYLILIYRQL